MKLEDILTGLGLDAEKIEEAKKQMSANKIFVAGEENLDLRYGKLKEQHEGTAAELGNAQKLIEELKKSTEGNAGLQEKITDYEAENEKLKAELAAAEVEAAVKLALYKAKANDIDYLVYKLRETGELKLDKDGEVKDLTERLETLKTQHPQHFGAGDIKGRKFKAVDVLKRDDDEQVTREAFSSMSYRERAELFEKSPEIYQKLTQQA